MRTSRGFTIVELLIVIVVIGILAAIVIVAFNGVQNRAYDTSVKADIRNFGNIVSRENAEKGIYPTTLTLSMGIKFNRNAIATNRNNLYYCVNTSTNEMAIFAQSRTGNSFIYTSSGGLATSGSLSGAQTCNLVGLTSASPQTYGFDFTNGLGWASWVNS